MWAVSFENVTTSNTSGIHTDKVPTEDVAVFCALEGYDIDDDDDVPGDTTFDNMYFRNRYWITVDITWQDSIAEGTGLSDLDVVIYSDSKVKLETAN